MKKPHANRSVEFFDTQFKQQIATHSFALNPFEQAVLPFIEGKVLDLGCGLGNLSVAAARKAGINVLALDASSSAIDELNRRALTDKLPIVAQKQDLSTYRIDGEFDTVLCIGLLMFFAPPVAHEWLARIKTLTRPGGIAAVNVLIDGTTYLNMFDQRAHTLFGENELQDAFHSWKIEHAAIEKFPAPGDTRKRFATVVARRS